MWVTRLIWFQSFVAQKLCCLATYLAHISQPASDTRAGKLAVKEIVFNIME